MRGVYTSPLLSPQHCLLLCMIKEGVRSRFFCPGQPPAHLSRIIRPPSILRHAQDPGAPFTCGNWASGGCWKISPMAGPCLMSVAPGVQLNPCLFRQSCWLRHATCHLHQAGRHSTLKMDIPLFFQNRALVQVKRVLEKAC